MYRIIAVLVALAFAAGLTVAPAAAQAPAAPKTGAPAKTETKPAAKKQPVDINTASEDELRTLPGIGEAYAKKITEHRPYKRKDELVQKKVVPQATYDTIKEQIIARQPAEKK